MPYPAVVVGCLAVLLAAGCSDSSNNLSSSDQAERMRAIFAVAARADDNAVEQLAPLVKDADIKVASEAIVALGRIRSDRAREVLQTVVTSEPRGDLRMWAATGLAQHKDPKVVEVLRRAVSRDPAPKVRAAAAAAVGRIGTVDDAPYLADAAMSENDQSVVRSEVTAIQSLVGVYFGYKPDAPPEARRAVLTRIRDQAAHLIRVRKGLDKPDTTCSHTAKGM